MNNEKAFRKRAEKTIKELLDKGKSKIIVYPFGDEGNIFCDVLYRNFQLRPYAVIDNAKAAYIDGIHRSSELDKKMTENAVCVIASDRPEIYEEIRKSAKAKFDEDQIVDLWKRNVQVVDYELICNTFQILTSHKIILYGVCDLTEKIEQFLSWMSVAVERVVYDDNEIKPKKFPNAQRFSEFCATTHDKNELIIIADYQRWAHFMTSLEESSLQYAKVATVFALLRGFFFSEEPQMSRIRNHLDDIRRMEAAKYRTMAIWISFQAMENVIQNNSILVYQPGKVGSQTIADSVGGQHVHWGLGWNRVSDSEEKESISRLLRERHIKIITAVRNPIFRDLSSFIQFYDSGSVYFGRNQNFISEYASAAYDRVKGKNPKADLAIKFDRCPEKMLCDYLDKIVTYELDEFNWFDDELKNFSGIDVFKYPFEKEKGWQIIRENNVEVLLLKSEKLSDLESVIGQFCEIPDFELVNRNIGQQKISRYVYDELCRKVQFSKAYIDYYMNSEKALHFYSRKEMVEAVEQLGGMVE